MSDMGWWSLAFTSASAVALVLCVLGYRGYVLSLQCQHEWEWESYHHTDVWGQDIWTGKRSEMPIRSHTDLLGRCALCGEPRAERVPGKVRLRQEAADD